MRDITLEDTFYHDFTTRAFATGIPTLLAGSPVLSVLEGNNATPITAGVSVSVSRASVVGLNEATIVATAANGYEAGKSYSIYISTGTVGGVSVIGEVVGQFTVEKSSAFIRLGAPAGASIAADLAVIEGQTDDIGVAGAGLTALPISDANVTQWLGTAAATPDTAGIPEVNLANVTTHGGTSAVLTLERMIIAATTSGEPAVKFTGDSANGSGMEINGGATNASALLLSSTGSGIDLNLFGTNKITAGAIVAATFGTGAITATVIAADAIGSSELATTAVNEIRDAILSDSTAFAGADIASILTDTGEIGVAGVGLSNISLPATGLDAILKSSTFALAVADAIWDELLTGATHNIATSAGKRLRAIDAAFEVHSGTAQAGSTSTTFVMDTGASATDGIYDGDRIVVVGGTGAQEHGIIISYVGATRTATMSRTWVITPDNTSEFEVVPADVDIETWSHVAVTAAQLAILDDWIDGGRLDLILDIIAVDTTTDIPALIAALNDLSAANLQTALGTNGSDVLAELAQAIPSATPSLAAAVMLLYMTLRNKIDVTASIKEVHNDAGTIIATKALTDDATTYSEAEMIAGT